MLRKLAIRSSAAGCCTRGPVRTSVWACSFQNCNLQLTEDRGIATKSQAQTLPSFAPMAPLPRVRPTTRIPCSHRTYFRSRLTEPLQRVGPGQVCIPGLLSCRSGRGRQAGAAVQFTLPQHHQLGGSVLKRKRANMTELSEQSVHPNRWA